MEHEEMLKGLRSTDDILLADLYEALDDELSKPKSKRNYKDIIELSRAICDLKGIEVTDEELEIGKTKILSKTKINTPVKKIIRVISSLAACTVVAFFINMFTVNAFNTSIFPIFYEKNDGSIVLHFDRDKIQTEENLKLIRNKCDEYSITELIPTYLPNGFKIVNTSYDDKVLSFRLTKDEIKINIYYDFYNGNGSLGIPSDKGKSEEKIIGNHTFLISNEDGQYRAIAISSNYHLLFTSHNLGFDEAEKIIRSLT